MEFLQVLSYFFMFLSFALIGCMILTFRKMRTVSPRNCTVSLIITFFITPNDQFCRNVEQKYKRKNLKKEALKGFRGKI